MNIIETLYQTKLPIHSVLEGFADPPSLLNTLHDYLHEIKQIPEVKSEENLKGRKRYLSKQTSEIVLNIIHAFGDSYPRDVIKLLAEQEYIVRNAVCDTFNLFEYLTSHIDIVQTDMRYKQLYSACYRVCAEHIYGKKVFNASGNKGDFYRGFHNEMVSNMQIDLSLVFDLHISTRDYDMFALGRSLGVSEDTLKRLMNANEQANFLYGPENPQTIYSHSAEKAFRRVFQEYVAEVNECLSKKADVEARVYDFFGSRTDINTVFYISLRKIVTPKTYKFFKGELMATIKNFNEIEDTYFGYEHMEESTQKLRQERRTQAYAQPLFR